ncbi:hypothetical protein BH09BAC2_BH09BAC2_17990 [soil metagenome]
MYKTENDKPLEEFKDILKNFGLHDALGFLSRRTPHRYTGIYKFDGDTLRNLVLYDGYDPKLTKGEDAPMAATYCSLVKTREKLEIKDSENDEGVKGKIITPVVSYCGVLIKDADGTPFGTLCHFDMKRCEESSLDFQLLEEAAKVVFKYLQIIK